MPEMNMVQALNTALEQELKSDKTMVVMGEDVGRDGGVFRVTEGLLKKFGKNRVIDTPLSESGIVGAAIGMAAFGMRPVTEIQFMGFIYPAFDQLVSHASRIRNRSRGRYTCPLVVRVPYGGGIKPPEHHSESTEAMLVHTPGLKVVVPSTPYEAKGLLVSAIRDPDPVVFLEPKRLYRAIKEEVPKKEYAIPLGEAKVKVEGDDVTLVSYGAMMVESVKAAAQARAEGISVEVIDLRTLSPMDLDTVIASVRKTGRAVVVHEAPKQAGVGAEITARINEKALLSLEAPVERVTGPDVIFPLRLYEDWYMPDEKRILKGIRKVMEF